jgi:hypothetical protein
LIIGIDVVFLDLLFFERPIHWIVARTAFGIINNSSKLLNNIKNSDQGGCSAISGTKPPGL